MEKLDFHAKLIAEMSKQLRHGKQVGGRLIDLLGRRARRNRLLPAQNACAAIRSHLTANDFEASLDELPGAILALDHIAPARMAVAHHPITRPSAKQLVDGQSGLLALNVPESKID